LGHKAPVSNQCLLMCVINFVSRCVIL